MDFPIDISVIMATYNTEIPVLKEAVDSILNQTFRDFEFLIIDDGSTNGSDAYLKSIQDERVRIIWNPQNIGVTKSLNVGLKQAKGKYIARMDADDVSLPTRLETQFAFMEAHPDVIVCGAKRSGSIIGEKRKLPTPLKNESTEEMEEYRVRMLFNNPGPIHPSAMLRHEPLLTHHILYNENLKYAQDYGMWEATSHFGRICRLNEPLVYRRVSDKQISVAKRDIQIQCDKMTQKKILSDLLGDVSDAEVDFHYVHSTGYYPEAVITPEVAEWYDRLIQANKSSGIYDQKKLERWIILLKKSLIRKSFKQGMSMPEKIRMMFRYLPFPAAVKMLAGTIIKRGR